MGSKTRFESNCSSVSADCLRGKVYQIGTHNRRFCVGVSNTQRCALVCFVFADLCFPERLQSRRFFDSELPQKQGIRHVASPDLSHQSDNYNFFRLM